MDTVTFDGLGFSVNVPYDGTAFSIGNFSIKWYAIFILIGLVLAVIYGLRVLKRYKVDENKFLNALIFGIIAGIIGARLYYVIFSWSSYKDDPIRILYIWEGGLAIYGGIIGSVLVGCIVSKLSKICIRDMLDGVFASFLLAQGIGRWGNFFNREAYGGNTTLPWGMTSESIKSDLIKLKASGVDVDPSLPVHPTFLYESLWCILGFVLIYFFVIRRRKFKGEAAVAYGIWYGIGRFFIEGLRTDSLMIGPFRVSQLLSALVVIVSIVLLIVGLKYSRKHPLTADGSQYLSDLSEEMQDPVETKEEDSVNAENCEEAEKADETEAVSENEELNEETEQIQEIAENEISAQTDGTEEE